MSETTEPARLRGTHLTKAGAHQLAARLDAYWHDQGHTGVKHWAVALPDDTPPPPASGSSGQPRPRTAAAVNATLVDNRTETALSRPGNDSADSPATSRMSCGRQSGLGGRPHPLPSRALVRSQPQARRIPRLPADFAAIVRDPVLHTRTLPASPAVPALPVRPPRQPRVLAPDPRSPRRRLRAERRAKTAVCLRSLHRGATGG
jgi:hypothetical protein